MLERIGYSLLLVAALGWLFLMVYGLIATLPYGLIGLSALAGIAVLFTKVVRERLSNHEDDHYSKNIHK